MRNKLNRRDFISAASVVGAGFATGLPTVAYSSGGNLCRLGSKTTPGFEEEYQKLTGAEPWSKCDLQQAILDRAARQKRRRELDVYYYRIGYTIAFRLPVAQRPTRQDLPEGITGTTYPWLTWLSWELEDRWRTLHTVWRIHGDSEAGLLLQHELAALAGWDQFVELNNKVSLVTAHVAASLSLALANANEK